MKIYLSVNHPDNAKDHTESKLRFDLRGKKTLIEYMERVIREALSRTKENGENTRLIKE